MENFVFCSPTEFVFGRDTQHRVGELVKRYAGHKVMIVYGGGSVVRSGLLAEVKTSLENAGVEYIELPGVKPNPTDDMVYRGIDMVRGAGVDFMLAVGGGSVIDTAKAIALGVPYDGDFWDFYCGKATPEKAMPVGVVLTIPAAGSEGSGNSVITKIEGHHKISVRYPEVLRPRFSIMNPELTYTLPDFQIACGVVDMICHIQERYFSSTPGSELTDGISESIMRVIMSEALKLKSLPELYDPRANIMWAGTLAHNGVCGVGKTEDWASHRLEHEVSALYNVAHGAGLAVIVPAWMQFCAKRNPGKVVQFAVNVMGVEPTRKCGAEVIAEGIEALRAFYHKMGLTTSLRTLVGCEPDIPALVASLESNMGSTLGNYVRLSMEDCAEIYRLAL